MNCYIILLQCLLLSILLMASLTIYYSGHSLSKREGFRLWDSKTMKDFQEYQKSSFPNARFNMQVMQEQTSDQDVATLIETGLWPWSDEVQKIYIDEMTHSQITKGDPQIAITDTRKIYNENAVKQTLAWNAKEGRFLIYGAALADDNTADKINGFFSEEGEKTFKCKEGDDGEMYMEFIDGDLGGEKVDPEDLPDKIYGFKFIRGVCNPCEALSKSPKYDCPFQIKTGKTDDGKVSSIWANLWKI